MLGICLIGFTVRVAIATRNTGPVFSSRSVSLQSDGRRRLVEGTVGSTVEE